MTDKTPDNPSPKPKAKPQDDPSATRRGYPALLGLDIRKIAKPMLAKKGFSEVDILANWSEIVGEDIAAYAHPLRVAKHTLYVSVKGGAYATYLTHQTPLLLSRLNTFFGFSAIEQIKITQDFMGKKKESAGEKKRADITDIKADLSAQDSAPSPATLPDSVNKILSELPADSPLKSALLDLGKVMHNCKK